MLLDIDVLIDYLRGAPKAVSYLKQLSQPLAISCLTVAELYAGVREDQERKTLDQLISLFEVLDINGIIAARGGVMRRDYGKSHGTGLVDALIAATAEYHQTSLVTLNAKHYPMLKPLVPYQK